MGKIEPHDIILKGKIKKSIPVTLRPLTEDDWDILLKWNSDPEVLYYSDANDVSSYSLEETRNIYRFVSQNAFCFIIEVDSKPVGECWLRRMNLERFSRKYPGSDCRRIDLMIGEKDYWGRGIGTEVVKLLTEFGFGIEGANIIFGCDIADYNQGSLRIFQKCGYRVMEKMEQPPGSKPSYRYAVVLLKEDS